MRRTRAQWLAQFFRLPTGGRAPPVPKQARQKRAVPEWLITLPPPDSRSTRVTAHTAGEARALAKRHFRLPGRLPLGSRVERLKLSQ